MMCMLYMHCSSLRYAPLAPLQDGLHYDVDSKLGVIFSLSDKYMLGVLGVLAVGLAPHHIMASMQQVGRCSERF